MEDGFPLEEAASGRGNGTVVEGLPIGPSADRLLDVAGAGEDIEGSGAGFNFDAAKAGELAGIENIAGVFVGLRCAEEDHFAGVAGGDEEAISLRRGKAEALLGVEVGDVGEGAVVLNAEDAAAIAGESEESVRAGGEGVDDFIFPGPELSGCLAVRENVDL